jgi:hypothetical protein
MDCHDESEVVYQQISLHRRACSIASGEATN